MIRQSIRGRLAAWYLLVLLLATSGFALASWLLLHDGVRRSADATLSARVEDVRAFIARAVVALPPAEFVDEFEEYAQLTAGDTLLQVMGDTGVVYCQPAVDGWTSLTTSLTSAIDAAAAGHAPRFMDARLRSDPFRVVDAAARVDGHTYRIIAATPIKPALDAAWRFGWILAGLIPVVVLAGGAGGYVISRHALSPVDRLSDAVDAITLDRLDRRVEVPAADLELQRLATTFNRTIARLESAAGEMARLTTEASHELRMPVTLIRTTAEVALAQPRSVDEYGQALTDILGQAERLSGLVNDLLTLARIDAGIEPADRQAVDLTELVDTTRRAVTAAMTQRQLTLRVHGGDAPLVYGSAGALGRVLLVLFDNAMKYTPANGTIQVAIFGAPDASGQPGGVVEVADSGMGIDPADRARVFDRFYRGAAARAVAPDGSGLGLAIARVLVERDGGSISLAAGLGATGFGIRVWLPAAEVAGRQRSRSAG